ncbi:PCI domain [Trypanosoma vivax]|nr:PCI domain [Trypanosoma vivax]
MTTAAVSSCIGGASSAYLHNGADLNSVLDSAENFIVAGKRSEAQSALEYIVAAEVTADDADGLRAKERAIYRLAEVLSIEKQTDELVTLLSTIRPFFVLLPKAKTTRMVRKMFDLILRSGVSLDRQKQVCHDMITWARQEKRTFLRHRLQHRLAEVQFARNERQEALATLQALLREVRRLDDRMLLLDIHLLESRIFYSINNISRARASLVAARTNANSIYCPPLSQAEIDLQSGVLHAEEGDAKTAFSYLYEAFEGFHQLGDQARQARKALQYMILAKIATNCPDELTVLLGSKNVREYKGHDMDALRGVAEAYNTQDTHLFNNVLQKYNDAPFLQDEVLQRRLTEMYRSLLEGHLLKLLEPYSRVQISYIAELLKLDVETVESQVSQLILDNKLAGIVDQQHQCVVVFDEQDAKRAASKQEKAEGQTTTLYQDALEALEKYDQLVTALFDKAAGKFDALVEENLAKRNAKQVDAKGKKNSGEKEKGKEAQGKKK